jgi:hypothetical protein
LLQDGLYTIMAWSRYLDLRLFVTTRPSAQDMI